MEESLEITFLEGFLEQSDNKFLKNLWNNRVSVYEGFSGASTNLNQGSLRRTKGKSDFRENFEKKEILETFH